MAVAIVIWLGVGESNPTAPLPEAPAAASTEGEAAPAAPVPEPDTAAQEGPVRVKKTPIVLTGTGTIGSWVEVRSRNADGRKVFEAILTPGEAKSFRVVEGIWIRAANPAELQVTVAGKEAELGSSATGNWIITPDGAKSVG